MSVDLEALAERPREAPMAAINRIDGEINRNRKLPNTPARRAREEELFRQRGEAQLARDIAEAERAMKAARATAVRIKRCPTCGR